MMQRRLSDRALIALLVGVLLLVCALQVAAYRPGLMTWDSIRQYRDALGGAFDDWHPPAMGWLWRQLLPVAHGPGPMLAIQLGLYWGGFAVLIGWAARAGRRRLALGFALGALLPLSLVFMATIIKDSLMAGLLLAACAILVTLPREGRWPWRMAGIVLLLAAATLRFNALPACLPIAVALLPGGWRATRARFAGAAVLLAVLIAVALPLANRAIGAKPSGVGLSLVTFDLAGITYFSGDDVFPSLDDVDDQPAANRACYTPARWDRYAWWAPDACPIQFESIRDAFAAANENPYRHWLGAVATHPLAYAEHRLAHFNVNTRFLVRDAIERPVQDAIPPNEWGFRLTPGALLTWFDRAARWQAATPLGWPIVWMALALGLLIAAPALASRRLVVPLALSGLLYGLGYLPASVASDLRYHLWTMLATLLAALIAADDLAWGGRPGRARLIAAAAPVVLITLLCVAWRVG